MHSDDNSDDTVEEGTQPTQLNEVPPDGNNGDDDVEDLSEDTHVAVQGLIGIGSDGAQEKQKESRAISIHEKDNSQVEGEEEVNTSKLSAAKTLFTTFLQEDAAEQRASSYPTPKVRVPSKNASRTKCRLQTRQRC